MKYLPYVLKHLAKNKIRTRQHHFGHGGVHLPRLRAADDDGGDAAGAECSGPRPADIGRARYSRRVTCRCRSRR